ncbi:hypothetical protein [Leeuwenhoekiella sp. ZYFB001]|uniref:hypothetical protein n=1 Tax=Leeuwenhoekiella sp. ZYFB001 TaxID=2719912 RepID=UPI00142FDF8B|nr:hypothetical protein [Leeuwenhoekiella sp. ZYFB001]
MNTETFTYLLEHPDTINSEQTSQLKTVLNEFPFFQAARALHLKGLKNEDSFLYNTQLKKTAAHTQDRAVLFDFITSDIFNQQDISAQIKAQEAQLLNMTVTDAVDVSAEMEAEELEKANKVLDPEFFIPKEEPEATQPEEQLQLGKPLDFNKAETHSFSEWLKLTSFNKINRSEEELQQKTTDLDATEKTTTLDESEAPSAISKEVAEPTSEVSFTEPEPDAERARRLELIDKFIESNPKIKVSAPDSSFKKPNLEDRFQPNDSLMTETLARVYVEQKNFSKAKQAYRILSLKYPEKSGFFADQIRAIEKLQENK